LWAEAEAEADGSTDSSLLIGIFWGGTTNNLFIHPAVFKFSDVGRREVRGGFRIDF
tara:strand:- start:356 stop:523 length:168 start_codon:yes stop_codon:yes gene_type:complete